MLNLIIAATFLINVITIILLVRIINKIIHLDERIERNEIDHMEREVNKFVTKTINESTAKDL